MVGSKYVAAINMYIELAAWQAKQLNTYMVLTSVDHIQKMDLGG